MFAALVLLSATLISERRRFLFGSSQLLVIALIIVVSLQWAFGLIAYRGDAALSILYLLGFGLAWWLGANAVRDEVWQDRFLILLSSLVVIAAALSVYIALLQWLGVEAGHSNFIVEKIPNGRSSANLAQPNHLATLLLMGSALSVLLRAKGIIRNWQLWVLLTWFAFGITMAESRASWVSAAAIGLLLIWKRRSRIRGGAGGVLAWWGLLVFMWASWKPLNESLFLAVSRDATALAQDPARLLIWRQMLVAIEQSPWWGYGWRQTIVGQKAGSAFIQGGPITDYAHSFVLDLCIWVGLPLALLLLALVAWWLFKVVVRIGDARQLLLMSSVLPVLVHSLVEFPFAYSYFLFTTAAILGALAALCPAPMSPKQRTGVITGRLTPTLMILAFTSISVCAMIEYLKVEDDYRVMRFEMRNVGQRPNGHEIPNLYLLDQLGEMLQLGRMKPYPGMGQKDIERLRIASEATMWATGQMRYAIALGLNDKPEEAARQLVLLRAYYGETSYKQAKALFLELQREEYPQLVHVKLP